MLLTRTPLYSQYCYCFLVRLACVKRAASVDSEPGSNSRLNRLVTWIPKDPITDVLDRFDLKLKQLTITSWILNPSRFKIASNQIFKDLRDKTRDLGRP